jgi:hypothetical protein
MATGFELGMCCQKRSPADAGWLLVDYGPLARLGPPDRRSFANAVDPIAPRSLRKEDEMNGA